MKLHVGTSGFGYREWKGRFYPADLPAAKMLTFYAERFSAVEINGSFRKLPTKNALETWRSRVPEGFTFVLKAPQRITHTRRLANVNAEIRDLRGALKHLGPHAGPVLFQLPPNMKKDLPRLREFLRKWGTSRRAAVEFRHPSWFDEATYEVLRKHSAALCCMDDDEGTCPLVATAGFTYLRLRKTRYSAKALEQWSSRVNALPVSEAFVFFKHEDTASGPRFARRLLKKTAAGSSEENPAAEVEQVER